MAAGNFETALARVLRHEGGYSNHPSDPGGPTNLGITMATYARFKGREVSVAEMRAMPLDDAKAIYRANYWNALRCDALPQGLDYALFDYGVNSGVARAAKVLQRLLGLPVTGRMSEALVSAACAANATNLIAQLCDERLAFLKSLKTWPVFGAGWGRRVAEVRREALAMAADEKPSAKPSVAAGAATIAAGAGAAAASHAAGAPMWALVVIAAGCAAAFVVAWAIRRKRKQVTS